MNAPETPIFADLGPDKAFAEAIAEGQFKIQHCNSCRKHIFYPRIACPYCGSADLSWVSASGKGTVYSTSVPRGAKEGDYNISLIVLAEGPRMMSRVVDIEPEQVKIGMAVEAFIGEIEGKPLVLFKPEQKEGEAS